MMNNRSYSWSMGKRFRVMGIMWAVMWFMRNIVR